MAAYNDMRGPDQGRPVSAGRFVHFVGGAVSLAIVLGVGVWGYRLVMRDVSGVPVVRATEGAMRVAPNDPGGSIAPHSGLSVNEVAAMGGAAAPEESSNFMLAPQIISLPDSDLVALTTAEAGEVVPEGAQPALADAPVADPVTEAPVQVQTLNDQATVAAADAPKTPLSAEDILAMADQLADGSAPMAPLNDGTTPDVLTALNGVSTEFIAEIVPRSVPGVWKSPPPLARPGSMAIAPASVAPTPVVPTATTEQALARAESVAVGTTLVQLGALGSAEIAQESWASLLSRFPDYMSGKEHLIQKAERGGRTFYRLRASGFTDLSDARRLCAALIAEGWSECVPVVVQ